MDAGRTEEVLIGIVVLTLMVTIIFQLVYGTMNVRGEPTTWQQWNGYKAGAAFTAIQDAESADKTAENYVQRKKKIISASTVPTEDTFICSKDLPGFITNGSLNIVTYTPERNCLDPLTGLNLTLYTEENITSLRLDTTPSRFRNRITEDVES